MVCFRRTDVLVCVAALYGATFVLPLKTRMRCFGIGWKAPATAHCSLGDVLHGLSSANKMQIGDGTLMISLVLKISSPVDGSIEKTEMVLE